MQIPDEIFRDTEEGNDTSHIEIRTPFKINPEGRDIELGIRVDNGRDMYVCVYVDGKMDLDIDDIGWCYVSCIDVLHVYTRWAISLAKLDVACGGVN